MNATEYKEHDPQGFEKAYWHWVEYAADYDWWDSIYDDFKERGLALGFDCGGFWFCGFYCQGSRAGGSGRIDVAPWMKLNGLDVEYPALYLACLDERVRIDIEIRERGADRVEYCETPSGYGCDGLGIFEGLGEDAWVELLGSQIEYADLEGIAHAQVLDFFHGLYKALQDEYEYLTSEEMFIEDCEANDVTFDS
jgi:hypothetical protein